MIKKLIAAFSNPHNWRTFILCALVLRGLLWGYLGHKVKANLLRDDTIEQYFVRDDHAYFFEPVDNFFSKGHFAYLEGVPFTGRLPGYSIVYFLFRLLFNEHVSIFLVIGFQFLLSAISVYLLSLIAYYIFNKSRRCFYISYWLYVLAVFPGFFDFFIIAESLSVSAIIFSLYYLVKYFHVESKNRYLILSGFFLTWTIFLREYTGLLIVLFPLALGLYLLMRKKEKLIKVVGTVLLFCAPFIVTELAWVTRNYIVTKQVILVTTPEEQAYGKLYSAPWEVLDNLVYTWGENASPFDKQTLGYYYRVTTSPIDYTFPSSIFNNVHTYNADSLKNLRNLYAKYELTSNTDTSEILEKAILIRCTAYKEDYISHNFFAYWFIKPLKDLKYLIAFSGTGYLPLHSFKCTTLIGKTIKVVFCILYYLVLITALSGILLYIFIKPKFSLLPALSFLSMAFIIGTLIFIGTLASYSSIQEPRYFVQCFAISVLFSSFFIDHVLPRQKQVK